MNNMIITKKNYNTKLKAWKDSIQLFLLFFASNIVLCSFYVLKIKQKNAQSHWNFLNLIFNLNLRDVPCSQRSRVMLKHRDSFGKENKTCFIFDKTLSRVFLNNLHALNRS